MVAVVLEVFTTTLEEEIKEVVQFLIVSLLQEAATVLVRVLRQPLEEMAAQVAVHIIVVVVVVEPLVKDLMEVMALQDLTTHKVVEVVLALPVQTQQLHNVVLVEMVYQIILQVQL